MNEEIMENGLVGNFGGYRIHGKSYDPEGNEIKEEHEVDCFCCREEIINQSKLS